MAQLVDQFGRPIETETLTQEIALPSVGGVRSPLFESVANSLAPERLAQILVGVDQNDILDILTLAEEMEERDLFYSSTLRTRKLAVAGLDFMVEAATDDAEDVKIRDAVAELIEDEPFIDLVTDLTDGIAKSFAVNEIIWDRSGKQWYPERYERRDQRFFQFDDQTFDELRLRDEADQVNGLPLAPYKWVQHRPNIKSGITIRGGIARLAVVAYMCKGYVLKDWLAFAEVFGMPLRIGKYGTAATKEQKAALLQAVTQIGIDAACIIPDGMLIDIEASATTSGGDKVFEGFAKYLDSQVEIGILGQSATTSGTPGKLGNEDEQGKVRKDILISDARQMSKTVRRDIIRPFVDLNFGPRARGKYPTGRFVIEEPEDLEAFTNSTTKFIDRGLKVAQSFIRDKLAIEEPGEDEELMKPAKVVGTTKQPDDSDVEPGEEGEELEEAKARAVVGIVKAVARGETLTADQRSLLALSLTAEKKADDNDVIDDLADDGAKQWEEVLAPLLEPILELAAASESYEEFNKGLEKLAGETDITKLTQAIGTLTFTARGIGDATDDV